MIAHGRPCSVSPCRRFLEAPDLETIAIDWSAIAIALSQELHQRRTDDEDGQQTAGAALAGHRTWPFSTPGYKGGSTGVRRAFYLSKACWESIFSRFSRREVDFFCPPALSILPG